MAIAYSAKGNIYDLTTEQEFVNVFETGIEKLWNHYGEEDLDTISWGTYEEGETLRYLQLSEVRLGGILP